MPKDVGGSGVTTENNLDAVPADISGSGIQKAPMGTCVLPTASTVKTVPVTSVDPNPDTLLPAADLKPISPVIADVGTFETNEPARTAKWAVVGLSRLSNIY